MRTFSRVLCLAALVWMPLSASGQPAVPDTWKRLSGAPSPDSAEYGCAGRTTTSWQVRFNGARLEAQSVEERDRRRDDLPYAIDFSGAIELPPPPLPDSGRTRADQQAWAVAYARDHAQRLVALTPDGWLVGFNAGEYGGSLWWYPASRGAGVKLSDRNTRAIIPRPDGTYVALVGLSHLGIRSGAVLTVRVDGGAWRVVRQTELRGAPFAHAEDTSSLVIVTDASVEKRSPSGNLSVLSEVDYGPLSPHSVAVGKDGSIAVGLRFFVHLLVPETSKYRHHWFVPPKCIRFDDRQRLGCACTGRD